MAPFRRWITALLTLALVATVSAINALALDTATIDAVARDLAPLDGYVIMPLGDEYLIDIDAAKGAQIGDLFGVIQPGGKIIHPITGEDLGSLSETLAILSITRIKSGYSYAKKLTGREEIAKGTRIKRFGGMTARLDGQGQETERAYQQLTAALPELDWQGFSATAAPGTAAADLRFILSPTLLEVRNTAGQLIHSYPVSVSAAPAAPAGSAPAAPSILPTTAPPAFSPGTLPAVQWEKTARRTPDGITYDAEYAKDLSTASIPGSTLMASFTETAEGLLLATTDGTKINVFRVHEGLTPLADYTFSNRSIHALSWWSPQPGTAYLAVSGTVEGPPSASTSTETSPSSAVLDFSAGRLTPAVDRLDYFLGSFDRDGDGRRETLLGQSLDLQTFYGRIRELHLSGDKISSTRPDDKLPFEFSVHGSLFADLTGDGEPEAVVIKRGLLTIFRGREVLYQSKKEMGGSISQLTYDTNPGQLDALFTSVSFEVPPVAADLDGDGRPELIAISSDHPAVIAPGSRSDIANTWLSVIKFQQGRFVKGTLGDPFESPLQGLHAGKDSILLISANPQNADESAAVSSLLTVPLQRGD